MNDSITNKRGQGGLPISKIVVVAIVVAVIIIIILAITKGGGIKKLFGVLPSFKASGTSSYLSLLFGK